MEAAGFSLGIMAEIYALNAAMDNCCQSLHRLASSTMFESCALQPSKYSPIPLFNPFICEYGELSGVQSHIIGLNMGRTQLFDPLENWITERSAETADNQGKDRIFC
jgi:hypothetical protein